MACALWAVQSQDGCRSASGPVNCCRGASRPRSGSGCLNIRSLFALGALGDLELDLLAFLEGFEAIHLDGGKVREKVFTAIIRRDESVTLSVVEPFDGTSCHECDLSKEKTGNESVPKALDQRVAVLPKPVSAGVSLQVLWESQQTGTIKDHLTANTRCIVWFCRCEVKYLRACEFVLLQKVPDSARKPVETLISKLCGGCHQAPT